MASHGLPHILLLETSLGVTLVHRFQSEVRTWRPGSRGLSQRLPVRLDKMSLALYLVPFGELLGGRFACGP